MCCRLEPTWILAGMIDWTCHLVLDALSGGIPLWWPSVGARQLENAWIAGLHTDARWTGVTDGVLGDQQWLQGWIDLLKDDNVRT